MARSFFDLSSAEQPSPEGGCLTVIIGDALGMTLPVSQSERLLSKSTSGAAATSVQEQYDGIIVDLFADGAVLADLSLADTWQRIKQRLEHGGRLIVNCGGPSGKVMGEGEGEGEVDGGSGSGGRGEDASASAAGATEESVSESHHSGGVSDRDTGVTASQGVVDAMKQAFGEEGVMVMATKGSERNVFAMTGRLSEGEVGEWERQLPEELRKYCTGWTDKGSVIAALLE